MASKKRERKRERKAESEKLKEKAELLEALTGLVICDRCGLLQPYRSVGFDDDDGLYEFSVPCDGPLGLPCDGESATFADDWVS